MIFPHIEELAEKALKETNCYSVPVDVMKCAKEKGIEVKPIDTLEDGISGFFVTKGKNAHIGYNDSHSENRKRFTIAHELGHFMLHSKEESLFVDKEERSLYRNMDSSSGEIQKEREANSFAAALLMPKSLLKKEINSCNLELIGSITKYLATKFKVSEDAMTFRLTNLQLLDFGLY